MPLRAVPEELATWHRLAIKWFLVALTVVAGASLKSFNTFANFGGALLLPAIAFVYPPMLYLKVSKADSRDPFWYVQPSLAACASMHVRVYVRVRVYTRARVYTCACIHVCVRVRVCAFAQSLYNTLEPVYNCLTTYMTHPPRCR